MALSTALSRGGTHIDLNISRLREGFNESFQARSLYAIIVTDEHLVLAAIAAAGSCSC
jgi:hypothetical protein